MKDIIVTSCPAESYEAIQALWSNSFFRESEYIQEWARRAAMRRPLFYTMTHSDIEWPHFTSYLCCVAYREYENKAIQDLYYLHELIHVAEMPHLAEIDFYNWRTGVFRNELHASLNSEVYAYFEIPELREASFEHEIWADRFLIPKWKRFYGSAKGPAQERLRRQRKLVSTNPNPHDYIEQQIAGYFHQNIQWAETWRDLYTEIAAHMHGYAHGGIGQKRHKEWLESNYGELPIPFAEHAVAFSQHYHKNRAIFGNHKCAYDRKRGC